MVRGKFKCESVVPVEQGFEIQLRPVFSGSEENEQFFNLTPWGAIKLGTINAEAAEEFEVDGEYFVDFTKAE